MQTPGMFIEYLINGSVALMWVLPILRVLGIPTPKETATIALFLPGLYVIGMIVDYGGWLISRPYKKRLRDKTLKELGLSYEAARGLQPKVFIYAPDLAKASEMRSSRDRIARGTLINVLFTTVVLATLSSNVGISLSPQLIIFVGLIAGVVCAAMWIRFQTLAYSYELRSMVAIEEKLRLDQARKEPASS